MPIPRVPQWGCLSLHVRRRVVLIHCGHGKPAHTGARPLTLPTRLDSPMLAVSVGQSRCPIPGCAFVGGIEQMSCHALDVHLPWYVRPDLHCDQCQRFQSDSHLMAHYKQEHGNVPAGRLQESTGNLSACLLFLAPNLCGRDTTSLYGLFRYTQRHHADNMLDIPFLWGMSSLTLDLAFL